MATIYLNERGQHAEKLAGVAVGYDEDQAPLQDGIGCGPRRPSRVHRRRVRRAAARARRDQPHPRPQALARLP